MLVNIFLFLIVTCEKCQKMKIDVKQNRLRTKIFLFVYVFFGF